MIALVVLSVVLFGVRVYAASQIGFGDSEALYASWAAHPQPAYLDHPGLLALVARVVGEGASPTPWRAHVVTAVVATAVPWIFFGAARAFGASRDRAAAAAVVFAVVPEIAVGLFGLTPDLLLAPLWLASLACAAIGLREPLGSVRGICALLGAGLFAGVATAAKVSGLLLAVALAVAYGATARGKGEDAKVARSIWPWAGLGAGLVVVVPVAIYEVELGFPMLTHRLFRSQTGVPFSNALAALGGQLVYVSPILCWLAWLAARDLVKNRSHDVRTRILFFAFAIPFVPLVLLSALSPVSEPHWLAPALLALPLHAAASMSFPRRRVLGGAAVAASFTLAAHVWVLVPASARMFPSDADPKIDIASELYGWGDAIESVRAQMISAGTPYDPEGHEVVVVGPHWTVCGQLAAALPSARVGCATPIRDDFDRWLPRASWREAHDVLWVTDNRFAADGQSELPRHVRVSESHVRVFRGGRVARVFSLFLYTRRAQSRSGVDGAMERQALREAVRQAEGARDIDEPDARPRRNEEHGGLPERHDDAEDAEHEAVGLPQREPDRSEREDDDEDRRARERGVGRASVGEHDADELEPGFRRGDRSGRERIRRWASHARSRFTRHATSSRA